MHMAWQLGDMSITTHDRGGGLLLPRALGDDERTLLVGAMLDNVFQHPLTSAKPYSITAVLPPVGNRATIIEFDAAPTEWRVPWSRPMDPF